MMANSEEMRVTGEDRILFILHAYTHVDTCGAAGCYWKLVWTFRGQSSDTSVVEQQSIGPLEK